VQVKDAEGVRRALPVQPLAAACVAPDQGEAQLTASKALPGGVLHEPGIEGDRPAAAAAAVGSTADVLAPRSTPAPENVPAGAGLPAADTAAAKEEHRLGAPFAKEVPAAEEMEQSEAAAGESRPPAAPAAAAPAAAAAAVAALAAGLPVGATLTAGEDLPVAPEKAGGGALAEDCQPTLQVAQSPTDGSPAAAAAAATTPLTPPPPPPSEDGAEEGSLGHAQRRASQVLSVSALAARPEQEEDQLEVDPSQMWGNPFASTQDTGNVGELQTL